MGSMTSLLQTVEILWSLPSGALCMGAAKCVGNPKFRKEAFFLPKVIAKFDSNSPIELKIG